MNGGAFLRLVVVAGHLAAVQRPPRSAVCAVRPRPEAEDWTCPLSSAQPGRALLSGHTCPARTTVPRGKTGVWRGCAHVTGRFSPPCCMDTLELGPESQSHLPRNYTTCEPTPPEGCPAPTPMSPLEGTVFHLSCGSLLTPSLCHAGPGQCSFLCAPHCPQLPPSLSPPPPPHLHPAVCPPCSSQRACVST
ncbi:hypothetical protein HJG60_012058 [Phyllostomus discolor]|uniref:Uncharacterized protein n=1 Tax=Phyllostomus discolor TaxID=89673 RepID=A0A833ZM38_9CHIR|nr:hypothetical protein HJG60_012058 [Phyllostomus discolor]